MAGILIGSALEAYEGDWKAIHSRWNQLVMSESDSTILVDREAIRSSGEEVEISLGWNQEAFSHFHL